MMNGISSYNNCMNCLQTARGRPDPAGMFNKVDSDGNGGVSQSELDSFVQDISSKTGNSIDSTNAVTTYDADGNGELSGDELKSFMEASGMKPPPPPRGGDAMKGVGSIGGSSTTSAESIVSQYDTNGDGVLSSDELQGYLDTSDTASLNALMQQALSAYTMNFGSSGSSSLEDALLDFGGLSGYSPVDLSA